MVEIGIEEKRATFLAGEGTLTVAEVLKWIVELTPEGDVPDLPKLPYGISDSEPLMVSVLPSHDSDDSAQASPIPLRNVQDSVRRAEATRD